MDAGRGAAPGKKGRRPAGRPEPERPGEVARAVHDKAARDKVLAYAQAVVRRTGKEDAWGILDPTADANPRALDTYAWRLVREDLCAALAPCGEVGHKFDVDLELRIVGVPGVGSAIASVTPAQDAPPQAARECVIARLLDFALPAPPETGSGKLELRCSLVLRLRPSKRPVLRAVKRPAREN